MMREIKFRAWNTVTEKMMLWDDIKKFGNLNKLISLNHIRVQQYTGLKDKNGVEIYEGDILDYGHGLGIAYVVYWLTGFALKSPGSDAIDRETYDVYEKCTVIGNIHQNPELL